MANNTNSATNNTANTNNPVNNETVAKNEEKKEKTYKIRIPLDPLNPKDKEVIVGINEKYAKVVRGEDTEVSEPVYEVLKNAGLV